MGTAQLEEILSEGRRLTTEQARALAFEVAGVIANDF